MRNPLVSVESLAEELAAGEVAAGEQPVLADVRWTLNGPPGEPECEAGHLPGAVWVDLETELTEHIPDRAALAHGPHGGRHPLPDVAVFGAAMRRIGVRADRPVVVYDGGSSLAASRLWWLLTDAGHTDVRVLDGGFAAWRTAGRPVETGPSGVPAPGDFEPQPGHRGVLDATAVLDAVRGGRAGAPTLVDVRAADRYAGLNETIDPVAGHIPGALNRPSTENLTPAGTFRSAPEILERFADVGEEPVLYCGSGITAAHTLLALESAGRTAAIYPGSWSDWISDPDRPRASGPTPDGLPRPLPRDGRGHPLESG